MSARAMLPVPEAVGKLERGAMVAGVAGLLLTAVGGVVNPDQFFRSYLLAFLFWGGIPVGCLSIAMIHHLSGGMWGLVIRRILEAGTRTLPLVAALFLPLLLGLPRVYEWARPEVVAADPVLRAKELYLNVPFFVVRAVFYFGVWWGLAYFMNRWSLELDARYQIKVARRLRGLSGGGLVLLGLTITFSSVDWGMSLNPHWFSTVYGILFMVGQVLSAMALVVVLLARVAEVPPFRGVLQAMQIHDLGKLLLAFVMLWAYINLSQFLIIWQGNLPEETPFYITRLQGGWQVLALILVVFHFALPFVMLLSRDLKRNARLLGSLAAGIFVVRLLDLYWLVAPDLVHGHGFHPHWLDLAAPLGLGGVWLWAFARELRQRPLLPVGEPEIRERLEGAAA
jgi:hypothetical protein